jgi:hypothetical protein
MFTVREREWLRSELVEVPRYARGTGPWDGIPRTLATRSLHFCVLVVLAVFMASLAPDAWASTDVEITSLSKLHITGGFLERQDTEIVGSNISGRTVYTVTERNASGPRENPGPGCSALNARQVQCAATILGVVVDMSDLDDTLVVGNGVSVPVGVTPGFGDDVVHGGAEPDTLHANLSSRDGSDQFYGGAGEDTAAYPARSGTVSLSLDGHSNDGAAGEGDFISGDVEELKGGQGDDTLTGNDLPNQLYGGDGNDQLTGGGGSDILSGNDGDDFLYDNLDATSDGFSCGSGFDSVLLDLKGFPPNSDCENVTQAAIDEHPNVVIKVGRVMRIDRRGRVHIRLACPRRQHHGCGPGRLMLTRGRHELATHGYSLRPGADTTIVLHLGPPEAARLRNSHSGVNVRATAREQDPRGRPKITIVSFRLR